LRGFASRIYPTRFVIGDIHMNAFFTRHAYAGIAAFFATVAMPSLVQAADSGFYGKLYAGPTAAQDMNFANAATANLALNPGVGFVLGGEVGYRLTDAFRFAFDLGYGRNDLTGQFQQNNQVMVPCGEMPNNPCLAPNVDGNVANLSGFAMAYYDLPVAGALRPYLGLGLGLVRADLSVGARSTMNNGTVSRFTILDGSDTVLGYRGTIGVSYDVGPTNLSIGYTYSTGNRFNVPGKGPNLSFDFDRRLTTHALKVGVSYNF